MVYGEQNGEKQYYLTNAHGDVDMLADGTGNVIKTYTYDAFGVETNKDEADTNPFRYAGEYYDGETDSIYLRARYYAPRTGRFTTEDPIRDGLNWYNYCGGNPVMSIDPSGMSGEKALRDMAEKKYGACVEWNEEYKYATVSFENGTSFDFTANPSDNDGAYLGNDGKMYVSEDQFRKELNIVANSTGFLWSKDIMVVANIFSKTPTTKGAVMEISTNGKVRYREDRYRQTTFTTGVTEVKDASLGDVYWINGYWINDALDASGEVIDSPKYQIAASILGIPDKTQEIIKINDLKITLDGTSYYLDQATHIFETKKFGINNLSW